MHLVFFASPLGGGGGGGHLFLYQAKTSVHTKIHVSSLPRTYSKVFGGWVVLVINATLGSALVQTDIRFSDLDQDEHLSKLFKLRQRYHLKHNNHHQLAMSCWPNPYIH